MSTMIAPAIELTISEEVARGIALLDERRPGWEHDIDLRTLRLSSTCSCVLGQLYGSFMNGSIELGLDGDDLEPEYGFDIDERQCDGDIDRLGKKYEQLQEQWKRAIPILRGRS